jgi:hypothetical protein
MFAHDSFCGSAVATEIIDSSRVDHTDLVPHKGQVNSVLVHKGIGVASEWEPLPTGTFGERLFTTASWGATLTTAYENFGTPTGGFLTVTQAPNGQGAKYLQATVEMTHIGSSKTTVNLRITRSGASLTPSEDWNVDMHQTAGPGTDYKYLVSFQYVDPSPALGAQYYIQAKASQGSAVRVDRTLLTYL